jgi:hypothetical protein
MAGFESQLHATVAPVGPASRKYVLTLENRGRDTLVNCRLHYSRMLGPGHFGVDDTYMRPGDWMKPPIAFERIGPGEIITFEVEGYGTPERYDGPLRQSAQLECAYLRDNRAEKSKRPLGVPTIINMEGHA